MGMETMILLYSLKLIAILIYNACFILGTLYLISEYNWPWWTVFITILLINVMYWFTSNEENKNEKSK